MKVYGVQLRRDRDLHISSCSMLLIIRNWQIYNLHVLYCRGNRRVQLNNDGNCKHRAVPLPLPRSRSSHVRAAVAADIATFCKNRKRKTWAEAHPWEHPTRDTLDVRVFTICCILITYSFNELWQVELAWSLEGTQENVNLSKRCSVLSIKKMLMIRHIKIRNITKSTDGLVIDCNTKGGREK